MKKQKHLIERWFYNKCCFLFYLTLTKSLAIDNNYRSSYLWHNLFTVVQLMRHSQFNNNTTKKAAHHQKKIKANQRKKILTNRSLLAHLYWVLVHIGRHRVTPPIWTVRKWSGHSQVCSRPPWRIRHRWEQPPLFTTQGLFTVRGRATALSNGLNSPQLGKYRLCIVQPVVFTCPQISFS